MHTKKRTPAPEGYKSVLFAPKGNSLVRKLENLNAKGKGKKGEKLDLGKSNTQEKGMGNNQISVQRNL